MVPAELDWVTGLWERIAGQSDEACRRVEAAAIGMEAASRSVLAAEAWISPPTRARAGRDEGTGARRGDLR